MSTWYLDQPPFCFFVRSIISASEADVAQIFRFADYKWYLYATFVVSRNGFTRLLHWKHNTGTELWTRTFILQWIGKGIIWPCVKRTKTLPLGWFGLYGPCFNFIICINKTISITFLDQARHQGILSHTWPCYKCIDNQELICSLN